MSLWATLEQSAHQLGFADIGAARAAALGPGARKSLEAYLAEGRNADMDYMARNVDKRLDVTLLVEGARSVMAFLVPYDHHDTPGVASFAHGLDYHKVIKDRIHLFVERNRAHLEAAAGGRIACRVFTDSAPVMEREWAVRCGLGFIGCNNFLISPTAGLRTLIGILVSNVPFEALDCASLQAKKAAVPDGCGQCHKCIEACPSGALTEAYRLDARRCLSFLTIESREAHPAGGQLYGCDRCMDACPWNRPLKGWPEFSVNQELLEKDPENIFSIFARNRK